jgi:glycosyltransferase involved in cell wall biosynthesis
LGADHVLAWARPEKPQAPYALAFGQYGNKNVRLLLEAWQLLAERRTPLPLKIVGFRPRRLPEAQAIVDSYGLGDTVELSGWLPDRDFQTHFTGAAMVVFPSDFEGFGLPAIEAMRLGIPLVITPERTLRAITGGLVTTAAGWSAAAIADAVERALPLIGQPADQSVTTWAEAFTWRRTANDVRSLLLDLTRDDNRRQRRWRLPSARALAATTRRSR